jgi:hypothetical protein
MIENNGCDLHCTIKRDERTKHYVAAIGVARDGDADEREHDDVVAVGAHEAEMQRRVPRRRTVDRCRSAADVTTRECYYVNK